MNRLKSFEKTQDYNWLQKFWATLMGESTDKGVLDQSMHLDFDPDTLATMTTYISEMVTAIRNGDEIAAEDYANLQAIVELINGLEVAGVGENVTAGIGEAMAGHGPGRQWFRQEPDRRTPPRAERRARHPFSVPAHAPYR